MFTMRLKFGSEENKEWRCFFCLHVRTATVLFGIWHLLLHILALTVLALIMRNHHVIIQKNDEIQNDFLPTPLSKKDDDNPYYLPTTQNGRNIYSSDIDMGALMTICTLSITLLMVYGTIKGKATHLLPFFFLELFDFAITTLTATGYFCYLRSAHRLIAEHWNLPFRHELLQLSPDVLTLVVLIAFILSMIWKSYWISVVWKCYKYLTLRQQSRNTVRYIMPDPDRANEPDFSLFADHEAALGAGLKLTPPPSYQDVMEDLPPPYLSSEAVGGAAESARPVEFPASTSTDIPSASELGNGEAETVQTETAQVLKETPQADVVEENQAVEAVNAAVVKETTSA